jgi:hypothetical protein
MNALATALVLGWAAGIAYSQRNPAEADRLASDLIELATRHNLVYFLNISAVGRAALPVTPRKVFR